MGLGTQINKDIPRSMCKAAIFAAPTLREAFPKPRSKRECLDQFSFLKTDGLTVTVALMRLSPDAKSDF